MAFYTADGRLINTSVKLVAASQTTAQLSASGNANERPDYIERLIITAASTAAPGTVALIDGTTTVFTYGFVAGGMTALTDVIDLGITATSTAGFKLTTGTSVSVVAIGRFS
jgi:hypothetical protein